MSAFLWPRELLVHIQTSCQEYQFIASTSIELEGVGNGARTAQLQFSNHRLLGLPLTGRGKFVHKIEFKMVKSLLEGSQGQVERRVVFLTPRYKW